MATELGLNQPPPPDCDEREALNRTRTWLNCYCVDGSHATQFGKLPMLSLDDYLARTSRNWYKESPLNTPYDVHLCAYVQILIHMAKWRSYLKDNPPTKDSNVCYSPEVWHLHYSLIMIFQPQEIIESSITAQNTLFREMDEWEHAYSEEFAKRRAYNIIAFFSPYTKPFCPALPICEYRCNTTRLYVYR